jgi:hypothetical protein
LNELIREPNTAGGFLKALYLLCAPSPIQPLRDLEASCLAVRERISPRAVFFSDPQHGAIALLTGTTLGISKKKVRAFDCSRLVDAMTAQKLVYTANDCGLLLDQLLGLPPEQSGLGASSVIVVGRDKLLKIGSTLLSLGDVSVREEMDSSSVADGDVMAVFLCLESSRLKLQGFRPKTNNWRNLRKIDLPQPARRLHLVSASA